MVSAETTHFRCRVSRTAHIHPPPRPPPHPRNEQRSQLSRALEIAELVLERNIEVRIGNGGGGKSAKDWDAIRAFTD